MRILALITDGYGGHGGIAKFNRDLYNALCSQPLGAHVTALPRVEPVDLLGELPSGLTYNTSGVGGKMRYTAVALYSAWTVSPDLVICGHINLLPVAALMARVKGAPLLLILHGIDAWTPHPSVAVRQSLSAVDVFVAVSRYTKDRFLGWASLTAEQGYVIPNCIDATSYGPGPKRDDLLTRYNLHERTTLLTLSRLSSEEQYKGHDEVLEVLPGLAREVPDIAYLICGDGDDRSRLEQKARDLGVNDRVVFAGYVHEEEKADHYRLADAFVMPGRGEGFGIVYLEALACGIPVVASSADASREAVRGGELGVVVDPDDSASVKSGIHEALNAPRSVPNNIDYFSTECFKVRWHRLVKEKLDAEEDVQKDTEALAR